MNQEGFDTDYEGNRILADVRIDGNLKADKSICLDGMIQGDVHTSRLLIVSKGALIEGNVNCDELYISGNVCVTRKTVMGAEAVIEGGLMTDCLEITPGARIGKGLKLKKASK